MKASDFDYYLPEELIAQQPLERRDSSRLLIVERGGAKIHGQFTDLVNYLREGDCLVFNDSRVIPARLYGRRDSGGAVEVLLLRDTGNKVWECITRPGRKTRTGQRISFSSPESGEALIYGKVIDEKTDGVRLIELQYEEPLAPLLELLGEMPLPPYIHSTLKDRNRYQTVYAGEHGSVAAPTAGLHFTPELLEGIRAAGVDIRYVTLHVGLGTFRPVKEQEIERHVMHTEYYHIPEDTAKAINSAKESGRRVISVGTTVCRTLESAADERGVVTSGHGATDIFITPGFQFRVIDALLTNFHLPRSTLLMLVSAFLGREETLDVYAEAVKERYRFFSFGDAMLIL